MKSNKIYRIKKDISTFSVPFVMLLFSVFFFYGWFILHDWYFLGVSLFSVITLFSWLYYIYSYQVIIEDGWLIEKSFGFTFHKLDIQSIQEFSVTYRPLWIHQIFLPVPSDTSADYNSSTFDFTIIVDLIVKENGDIIDKRLEWVLSKNEVNKIKKVLAKENSTIIFHQKKYNRGILTKKHSIKWWQFIILIVFLSVFAISGVWLLVFYFNQK